MSDIKNGFIAGFVATVVLSILMVLKAMMGLMPDLNVVAMLSKMMGSPPVMGWLAHFVVGTIAWGGLFALIHEKIPGGALWVKGVVFAVGAWLAMMIVVMPMAGAGLFGMNLGIMAPMMTLVLHIIFGAVLGGTFASLRANTPKAIHSH